MAPKLTSCDVFGMLLKYWLSIEGGFIGGERVNLVDVLVSGGLPWALLWSLSVDLLLSWCMRLSKCLLKVLSECCNCCCESPCCMCVKVCCIC